MDLATKMFFRIENRFVKRANVKPETFRVNVVPVYSFRVKTDTNMLHWLFLALNRSAY